MNKKTGLESLVFSENRGALNCDTYEKMQNDSWVVSRVGGSVSSFYSEDGYIITSSVDLYTKVISLWQHRFIFIKWLLFTIRFRFWSEVTNEQAENYLHDFHRVITKQSFMISADSPDGKHRGWMLEANSSSSKMSSVFSQLNHNSQKTITQKTSFVMFMVVQTTKQIY